MEKFSFRGKNYKVDKEGFLLNYNTWDENFAEGIARKCLISQPLTKEHWAAIRYVRKSFGEIGRCPTVYETCRMTGLDRKQLKTLFPSGYLRGACKIAGITYSGHLLGSDYTTYSAEDLHAIADNKTYHTNLHGFLVDAGEWDVRWAAQKAFELMKIPGGKLIERQWQLIHFLRQSYEKNKKVPTVYETCEAVGMELDVLESLFPDGYHRGLVKIAGLRVR